MNPSTRDYTAFVSYRHQPEDKRWAEWLVEALETFETPDELVRAGTRRRIGKVFRDDNELGASADLTDGQATRHKDGCARITAAYDTRGNLVEEAYFGIHGRAALQEGGYARIVNTYDAASNLVGQACFGADGEPVQLPRS